MVNSELNVMVNEATEVEWDAFVKSCTDSTFAHLYGWRRIIKKSYGHDAYYISIAKDGELVGVFPLIYLKSKLFGSELVSMPYLDYGGVLIKDGLEGAAQVTSLLVEEATAVAAKVGVSNINVRQLQAIDVDWEESTEKVTMLYEMVEDEARLLKGLSSERRNRIRKAMRNNLTTEMVGPSGINDFYNIFAENMRDLGSPVHSKEFLAAIMDEFPEETSLFVVKHEDMPIGSAIAFTFNGMVSVPWVSSLRSHFKLYPNIALYWEIMKYTSSRGVGCFDFGRSTVGSGTFEFKRRWGAATKQIHWYDSCSGGKSSVNAADRHSRMINIWKKMPMPLTRVLGPMLRAGISN